LFSASHGAAIETVDPNQRRLQGSIVCQNCAYPLTPVDRAGFVTGFDVPEGFHLPGGVCFIFACYGAGTRRESDFVRYVPSAYGRKRLGAHQGTGDFTAHLPQRLLADPQGGALAVIGHIDPAWTYSFVSPVTGERRTDPFGFSLVRLLKGKPVGHAVVPFAQRHGDISTDLLSLYEHVREPETVWQRIARALGLQGLFRTDRESTGQGMVRDPRELGDLWICRNDARNYVVLGDPAVRLRFAEQPCPAKTT
jgi:hypothetical protein